MDYPTKRVAKYNDLFSVPDNMVGEIIAGELVTQPRPGPKHARAASAVAAILFTKYDFKSTDDPHGWWIIHEPECHLGTDVVVPDIAGWKKSTMPELPETAWFSTPPDWVCEVISPSTAKYDRGSKRDIYARDGIGHFWIVDPVERMIEVFNLENNKWILAMTVTDNQVAQLPPFVELSFDLSVLWA